MKLSYVEPTMISQVLKISVPAIIANLSFVLLDVVNMMFVGHLGEASVVAGLGLATAFRNIFGQVIILGLNFTLITFVSQSYGHNDLKMCGNYLNRARVLILFTCIPISLIMIFSGSLFKLVGLQNETSVNAEAYIVNTLPQLIFVALFDLNKHFLNCFSKGSIVMTIQLFALALHYGVTYAFVDRLNLGLIGVAYATNISAFVSLILITFVSSMDLDIREAWFFPGRDSILGLRDYLKLAIPSMLMQCLESWAFSIQTLMLTFTTVDLMAA